MEKKKTIRMIEERRRTVCGGARGARDKDVELAILGHALHGRADDEPVLVRIDQDLDTRSGSK